jgi:hypothetical protein
MNMRDKLVYLVVYVMMLEMLAFVMFKFQRRMATREG